MGLPSILPHLRRSKEEEKFETIFKIAYNFEYNWQIISLHSMREIRNHESNRIKYRNKHKGSIRLIISTVRSKNTCVTPPRFRIRFARFQPQFHRESVYDPIPNTYHDFLRTTVATAPRMSEVTLYIPSKIFRSTSTLPPRDSATSAGTKAVESVERGRRGEGMRKMRHSPLLKDLFNC